MQTSCLSLSRWQRTLSFCQFCEHCSFLAFAINFRRAQGYTDPICGVGKVSVCVAAKRIYSFALLCGSNVWVEKALDLTTILVSDFFSSNWWSYIAFITAAQRKQFGENSSRIFGLKSHCKQM
jgi:hypothetical protein